MKTLKEYQKFIIISYRYDLILIKLTSIYTKLYRYIYTYNFVNT